MERTLRCTICTQPVKPLEFYIKECRVCNGYICYNCQIERDGGIICPRCKSILVACDKTKLDEELLKALKEEGSNRSSYDFSTFSACIPSMHFFDDLENKLNDKDENSKDTLSLIEKLKKYFGNK